MFFQGLQRLIYPHILMTPHKSRLPTTSFRFQASDNMRKHHPDY